MTSEQIIQDATRFNLNIVECKVSIFLSNCLTALSFNLNIVECKAQMIL